MCGILLGRLDFFRCWLLGSGFIIGVKGKFRLNIILRG